SEVVKIALILWTADKLARKGVKLRSLARGSASILLVTGILGLLVAVHDLGTAVAIVLVAGIMLFSAGVPMLHLMGMVLGALGGMVVMVWRAPYRWERIASFRNPWLDPQDTGYHLIQSLYAIGSGGLWGRGLGKSLQKEFFLPDPHNDFIFSVLAEELGFLGAFAVIALFLLVAWRGIRAALRAPDTFSALLACGVTAMVVTQAAINIAVVTGSIPVTGITLPLVSYGGSSLLITMVSLGILINITRYTDTGEVKR
ncbi:MAG TPA: putative peptidoglycan glycosyltransferase FtsW, partial [Bacillota bacterium]|nr:putative peptidoglycan glycosyltransferase FtsW [Bacillota bacterium]